MSGITLSASVRQNLLSLQSTSQLLATTQERLATGNKVNSALDNPTNFFTAQSLNNRASDISNLLDSISNGVQVLQAANTGITSLQKLIDSAKSVANQALQATSGYTTKSQVVSTTINGATANNQLGTATYSDVAATAGSVVMNNATGAPTNAVYSGAVVDDDHIPGTFDGAAISAAQNTAATLNGGTALNGALSTAGFASGDSFSITIGSTTRTFQFYDSAATDPDPSNPATGVVGVDLNGTTGTGADLVSAINGATGFNATVASLDGTTNGLDLTAASLTTGALTSSITVNAGSTSSTLGFTGGSVTAAPVIANPTATAATLLQGPTNNVAGSVTGISAGNSFTVNGKTVTFASSGGTAVNAITGGQIDLSTATVGDVVSAINTIAGGTVASIVNGDLHIDANNAPAGINVSIANGSGTPLAALGISGPQTITNTGGASSSTGITASSLLKDPVVGGSSTSTAVSSPLANTDSFTVNGVAISFDGTGGGTTKDASGYHIDLNTATVGDVLNAIDKITGTFGTANASTVSGGKLNLSTGTQSLVIADGTGAAAGTLAKLGLSGLAGTNAANTSAAAPVTGSTALSNLATGFSASDTIVVDGKTISFSSTATSSTSDATGATISLTNGTVQDVLDAVDKITGTYGTSNASTISGGQITLHTGTAADLSTSGTGLAKLGLTPTATPVARQANGTLSGLTLSIGATDGGSAVNITFGSGAGQVDTLDELNTALASDNLEASLDTTGKLTITTTNDHSSATIGAISGTAVTYAGSPFSAASVAGPVANTDSQNSRAALVSQYNDIIDQLRTTAQDSSYNGVNRLNGDQLKLVFNETGTSTLNIKGVTDDPSGLGLSYLTAGTDFLDNASTNKILSALNSASSTLRSQGSTLGSNLSIVQIRQDFSNNLINVLQTGASNLTLADTNEEAANSQALSTRQSIAVSALALANQSQQSVLRLLQ